MIRYCQFVLFVGIFITSCSGDNHSYGWINKISQGSKKNGQVYVWQNENYYLTLEYRSIEELLEIEQQGKIIDSAEIVSRKKEFAGYVYFLLKIYSKNNIDLIYEDKRFGSTNEERENYFTNEMQGDLKLLKADEIVSCEIYNFELSHQISPCYKVMIGFPMTGELYKYKVELNWQRFGINDIEFCKK